MVILRASLPTAVISSTTLKSRDCFRRHNSPTPKISSPFFISNSQDLLFHPPNQGVAAIVLGDRPESRLYPLTKRRSEAAIPIAANYRLIDAVVSNCINSNITKIYALTQFNSTSLNSHLSRAYSGARLGKDGFVEVIAAYQSHEYSCWFQGNADAVRRCLGILEEYPVVEFLVLPGHHLYRMDYQKLLDSHRSMKADVTVALVSSGMDRGFGIFKLNSDNQVLEFNIKPVEIAHDDFPSMGIYVINRDVMTKLLREYLPNANDFTSEVIPGAISLGLKVNAYRFDGYWEDMTSIEAFYQANMDSTRITNVGYNFYDKDSPVYTLPRFLPPTLITNAVITDSVIGDGCILNRCKIKGTVLGLRTRIGNGAIVEDSVIMGSDIYQIENVRSGGVDGSGNCIPIGIGEGSHIKKAIVDKNARIGKNVMIINKDKVQEGNQEAYGYVIKAGLPVIMRNAIIPDGSIL